MAGEFDDNLLDHKVIQCLLFYAQGLCESPDLEFEYADTDKWAAELSGACDHHRH